MPTLGGGSGAWKRPAPRAAACADRVGSPAARRLLRRGAAVAALPPRGSTLQRRRRRGRRASAALLGDAASLTWTRMPRISRREDSEGQLTDDAMMTLCPVGAEPSSSPGCGSGPRQHRWGRQPLPQPPGRGCTARRRTSKPPPAEFGDLVKGGRFRRAPRVAAARPPRRGTAQRRLPWPPHATSGMSPTVLPTLGKPTLFRLLFRQKWASAAALGPARGEPRLVSHDGVSRASRRRRA